MKQDNIHELIKKMFKEQGRIRAAKAIGISVQYLSDIIHDRRKVSSRVAEALGFEKIVIYRRPK